MINCDIIKRDIYIQLLITGAAEANGSRAGTRIGQGGEIRRSFGRVGTRERCRS